MNNSWYQRARIQRFAVKAEDLSELSAWNDRNVNSPAPDLATLRQILGRLMVDVNQIGEVLYYGTQERKGPSQQHAQQLLPYVTNLNLLPQFCERAGQIVARTNDRAKPVLLHMLHSLENSTLDTEHQQMFQDIASGAMAEKMRFTPPTSVRRMENMMAQQAYATKNPVDVTLKVVREVLQNAADAVRRRMDIEAGHKPEIVLTTNPHDRESMDIQITDNGVGMDWETLSQKFYIYYASGKEEDPQATGGLGLAKFVIQRSPKEGWAIDTNQYHGSSFARNVYLSRYDPRTYNPPRARDSNRRGTTLSMFNLAFADDSNLRRICEKYSTSDFNIVLNGERCEPAFKFDQWHALGQNMAGLADAIGKTDSEKRVIDQVVKQKTTTGEAVTDAMRFDVPLDPSREQRGEKGVIEVQFKVQPTQGTFGKFYVFLNGQFQFEDPKYWITKADLVCLVRTNTRPTDPSYPMSYNRDSLKPEPIGAQVDQVAMKVKETLDRIAEDELFKEGLDVVIKNENLPPEDTGGRDPEAEQMVMAIQQILQQRCEEAEQAKTHSEYGESYGPPDEMTPDAFQTAIMNSLSDMQLSEQQRQIAARTLEMIIGNAQESKINVAEATEEVASRLSKQYAVGIQHGYVSDAITAQNEALTTNLLLLWQDVVSKVVNFASKTFGTRRKKYIVGTIYSDEAIGLHMSPRGRQKYHGIYINPPAAAAIVHYDALQTGKQKIIERISQALNERNVDFFEDQIAPTDSYTQELEQTMVDESTFDRFATFIYQVAVHEATHLLFADAGGMHTNFHNYITKMLTVCATIEADCRKTVRKYWKYYKVESANVITALLHDLENSIRRKRGLPEVGKRGRKPTVQGLRPERVMV